MFMSGLNENLPKKDKVQCLMCLSSNEPKIENNRVFCSECGAIIQTYLDMPLASMDGKQKPSAEATQQNN